MAGEKKPAQKEQKEKKQPNDLLAFLKGDSAKHMLLVAGCSLPGAAIIAIFLLFASVPNMFLSGTELLSLIFLPTVCLFPLIGGAASSFALFRFSKEPPEKPDSAMVGALAGLFGSLFAAFLMVVAFFLGKLPFGGLVKGALLNIASALIVVLVCVVLSLAGSVALGVFLSQRQKQKQMKLQ